MNFKKAIIIGLIALCFILLLVSVLFFINSIHNQRKLDPVDLESMTKEQILQTIYEKQSKDTIPFYYFIPLFGFFGVVVGLVMYFIVNIDLEKKDKVLKYNTDVILHLLNPEERKIINKIVESDGKLQQVEITYMEGYTKVKAHRIVESLVQKGILSKEVLGKMRLIRMNKDIYEILRKKDSP